MGSKVPTRTLYLVRQIQLEAYARLEDRLRPFELTPGQYTVMAILEARERLSSAQLARRMSMTPQSMTELIASLERKQLVSRQEAPSNRRVLETSLTPTGRHLVARCNDVVDTIDNELCSALSRSELRAFREAMTKVIARIRAQVISHGEKA